MQLLTEIRIGGFGGQGVILAAAVIGKAAAIFQGGYATMTQSFGPEARGGSSSAQVILSTEPILYPYVVQPDILVVMSQEAYTRFAPQLKPGGILITEQEMVRVDQYPNGVRAYGVPATRLAEELGRKVVLNIVMVGFFGAVTNLLEPEALRKSVADSVPPAMQKLNLQAFDKGFEYGSDLIEKLAENGGFVDEAVSLESA
jgi:2-oxoglutarate ferredoxin oxidoreductase subunit gamma